HRFDHHRGIGPPDDAPADDAARGVYYAALSFSGCIVEVFGDDGSIAPGEKCVAGSLVTRDLFLLDLPGSGAMRAGSLAALAKVADRSLSQAWARHFYDLPDVYGKIDGIAYHNAHNDEDALVLFERAEGALICAPDRVLRLDDPLLRPALEDIALRNN